MADDNNNSGDGQDFNAKVEAVTTNIRQTLEKEYAKKYESQLAKATQDSEAKVSAVYDQIAEGLGYDGRFDGVDDLRGYFETIKGSGDVDVTKTKEYNSLKEQYQNTLKEAESAKSEAQKIREDFENKEKQRRIQDTLSSTFSEIAKDYSITPEDAILLYKNKRELALGDNGVSVKDVNGNPLFTKDGNERSLLDDMRETFKGYIKNPSGAGGQTGGGQNVRLKRSEMSNNQVNDFIEQNGIEAYMKLPQ